MYESLVELLSLLGDIGFQVEIVCPGHDFAGDPVWTHHGVTHQSLQPTKSLLRMPMTARLLQTAFVSAIKNHPSIIMGADRLGSVVAAMIARFVNSPLLYYGLELPLPHQRPLSWLARMEHWSIRTADLIVTMDRHHADFITNQTGADASRIALLPNAASGRTMSSKNDYLRKRYPASSGKVLILHAGGIGCAQQSLALAQAAESWGSDRYLVFHAHCRMEKEDYFQNFAKQMKSMTHSVLNNEPVSPEGLDEVISSSDIGIAWYDRKFLGYRADLLGLAPGKVGRYLRNGIPVIAPNLPTVKEYIDKYRCGICVDSLDQIEAAIETIMAGYELFHQNALCCYEELWQPEPYLETLKARLDKLCAPGTVKSGRRGRMAGCG